MNAKIVVAILTLTTTMFFGALFAGPVSASDYTGYGPQTSEMSLRYFADETSLYTAVKANQIDFSLWEATRAQYYDAITDPNLILCPVSRLDMRAFSLNNNMSIAALPGKRIATSSADFRKALWCMVDRDYYTQVICGGFATPVYVMISAPSTSWVNATVENFVKTGYAYNILTAHNYLDAGGFTETTTPNPYYNPSVPGSAQYMRSYPSTWPSGGNQLDPVVFSARVDDGLRYAASVHLRDRMLMSGIPVNFISEPSSSAFLRVMTQRNYMIYSAGWTTGRFATYSWSWYHTSRWVPGGSNYHVATTAPDYVPITYGTHPDKRPEDYNELDYEASKVWYPPSFPAAVTAAKKVQSLATIKYATFIPLWCGKAFFYYRNLYGVTNQDGTGPENTYTFQEMRRADPGGPDYPKIRVGHKSPPTQVNQIYSSWVWDVTTMGQTQDGFFNLNPYDLLLEQPGLAKDWTNAPGAPLAAPDTWLDPDTNTLKSKMSYWFHDDPNDGVSHAGDTDAEWIINGLGPQAGTVLADFATQWLGKGSGAKVGQSGYEWECWYYDSEPAGWLYGGFMDIKHIVIDKADNRADVYFDVFSYWSYLWPFGRNIYSDQPGASTDPTRLGWKTSPLATLETKSFLAGVDGIPRGTFLDTLNPISGARIPQRAAGAPVEITEVKVGTTVKDPALTPQSYNPTDGTGAGGFYRIVGGSTTGARIKIFEDVPAGSTLTVTYWARGTPAGYWPGGLNFQTTLIGTGQYYMTDFLAGVGGYATYKANEYNYMQNAPLGEVDWYWYWIDGTQPRDGYYVMDLIDLAYIGAADGSSAYAVPTPGWNPAADIVTNLGLGERLGMVTSSDFIAASGSYDDVYSSWSPNPPP